MFLPGFTMGVILSRFMKKVVTYQPMYAGKHLYINFHIFQKLKF